MARIEVPMPQMGESIAEGTVSVWLKKVGERVERDEPIMEISTDKVDAEIPSPTAGVLAEIVVAEGQTVEVGTVVAFIETEAAAMAQASGGPSAPAAAAGAGMGTSAGDISTTLPEAAVGEPEVGSEVAPEVPDLSSAQAPSGGRTDGDAAPAAPSRSGSSGNGGPESAEERLRRKSSPLVRRIAAEHGIEVGGIPGTGRAGRVTKNDILGYLDQRKAAPAAAPAAPSGPNAPVAPQAPAAPQAPRQPQAPRAPAAGDGDFGWEQFYTEVQHPEVAIGANDRVEPMSRMTTLIAQSMVLSRRISPHVHSYFEVDYSRIDQVRAKNRRSWEEQGVKITYTAFITRAVAQALREHPKINATLSGDSVVFRGDVNIGVAVALDNGLIVPVVRNADELSLAGLARRITDLATRARSKKLKPEEVQGGTFTITNPGIFGTTIGFPIINQPQVAILGVGGVEKRAVVVTDEFGNDAIVARKRGYLSLGYDHRLVNGADGDQFLARIKQLMESALDNG